MKQNSNEEDTSDNFTFNINTLPQQVRNNKFYIYKWYKKDGDFVNENNLLLSLRCDYLGAEIHPVKAPCSGVLEIIKQSSGWDFFGEIPVEASYLLISNGDSLFVIHKQCDDNLLKRLKAKRFENIPSITIDEFTNKKEIKWEKVCRCNTEYYSNLLYDCLTTYSTQDVSTENILMISLNYIEDKDYIIFRYIIGDFKLNIGDKILFLFENKIILKFQIINKPFFVGEKSLGKIYETRVPLTLDDINVLKNKNFIKWQIQFLETEKKITMGHGIEPYYDVKDLQYAIKKFANDYYEIVTKEIENYKPLIDHSPTGDKVSQHSEDCYVYLMVDHTNNYHKIGISNSPDYREKTLQSEKPTIEIICSKKFPNRKIALIFEKTLHQTYSGKRVRGEWFQLDNTEVEEIKKTLK